MLLFAKATAGAYYNRAVDLFELEYEMIKERQAAAAAINLAPSSAPKVAGGFAKKNSISIRTLNLDASSAEIKKTIEIEKGTSAIVVGRNIKKFLLTQADILSVKRLDQNNIIVTATNIGYDYLYVWDDQGRWQTQWIGVFPKPQGESLEEEARREEEHATAFKLSYNLDWYSFEQGRGLDSSLKRQYYSWNHSLRLAGSTPYGDLESLARISTLSTTTLNQTTDLNYYTIALQNGRLGPFQDFSLRGFDFYPSNLNNLILGGGTNLRGFMFMSPAFDKRMNYTVFWGQEAGGSYGILSPGIENPRKSYLSGTDVNFSPTKDSNYGLTVIHGYGSDRDASNLGDYAYDAYGNWHWGDWGHRYEVGYDSKHFANVLSGALLQPKMQFTYELRDYDKDYINMVANTWRQGELGGLFTLQLQPTSALRIDNRLDMFQDRQFPATGNEDQWNQDYDFNLHYDLNPTSALRMDYSIQNELQRLTRRRYQSSGAGINKMFSLIRKINTYVYYNHQDSTTFNSSGLDYRNDRISVGLNFSLIGPLSYFLNGQCNWLQEVSTGNHSMPQFFETGLMMDNQIFNSPFYESTRLVFHDEHNTESPLSFLSGEDYLEGYAQLSFRPMPEMEYYGTVRVRNVWASNPNVNKRVEAEFNAGMRYLWNTGIHWDGEGDIEGYVFRDLNSDGLRQRDEAPVEGIKIWLGKDKFQVTDLFGYYRFKKVKAKKAYVTLDVSTLPAGFVLTVPFNQQTGIYNNQTMRVDFGIIARLEINGLVFEDVNGNNEYAASDKPVRGIVLMLEDGKKVTTDNTGRYLFSNVSPGEHTLILDLNSLPIYYLPKVAISHKVNISEGNAYTLNIPLRRIEE